MSSHLFASTLYKRLTGQFSKHLSQLKYALSILLLVGCVQSSYPLIKKEESISPIASGRYCFVPSHVYVSHDSQCGWLGISLNKGNSYKFKVFKDNHETITGSDSNILKNISYFSRISSARIKTGALKGWYIIQSCMNANDCKYFALRKITNAVFEVAVASNAATRVSSKAELLRHFSALRTFPKKIIRFYSPKYLTTKANERAHKQRLIRKQNEGDL